MVPDPRKALVERLLDRLYPVTPNGRTGFAWKEYDATKAELLALLATDPTTLRAALEALVQKWSDEAISAMSNGLTEQAVATEWCASDLRAVLATPAPAADPTTLRTALGLSVFTLAGFAQHRPWCPEAAGPADCTCGLYGLLDAIQCVCGHKVSVHTTRQVGDAVGWPCGGCKSDRCTGFAIAIAALATPAPAADEARCAFVGCGGVRDDVFHEPCLPGGAFHDHKACHPFQPAPTPAPAADEAHAHEWHYYDGNETEGTEYRCRCGAMTDDQPAPTPAPPTPSPEGAGMTGCVDPKAHRKSWRVTHRRHNHSAFNGYHWTFSAYSEVECPTCMNSVGWPRAYGSWRTRAAYVADLPGDCTR